MRSGKIFAAIIIIIAILLAIFASILPQDKLAGIIYFTRFFDIMIPVLAVGALIKYLFSCPRCITCNKATIADKRVSNI